MFDEFKEWVVLTLTEVKYKYSKGQWVEKNATDGNLFCSIIAKGGPPTDAGDRRQRFGVILLGRRNERADVAAIQADIYALAEAALGDAVPCGAAGLQAIGEPIGPGYTTENRVWFSLDFEVTF